MPHVLAPSKGARAREAFIKAFRTPRERHHLAQKSDEGAMGAQLTWRGFEALEGEPPRYLAPGLPGYDNATYLTTLHEQRAQTLILAHNRSRPLFLLLAFAFARKAATTVEAPCSTMHHPRPPGPSYGVELYRKAAARRCCLRPAMAASASV